jgi:hypothetical protein
VSENKDMRRIFGPKEEEVLNELRSIKTCSHHISVVSVIKSRRMRLT